MGVAEVEVRARREGLGLVVEEWGRRWRMETAEVREWAVARCGGGVVEEGVG